MEFCRDIESFWPRVCCPHPQQWVTRLFFTSLKRYKHQQALQWEFTLLSTVQSILFGIFLVISHILAEGIIFLLRWLTVTPLIVLQEHLLMNELVDNVSVCWLFVSVLCRRMMHVCHANRRNALNAQLYYCAQIEGGVRALVFLNVCVGECHLWVIPLAKLSWEIFRVLLNMLLLLVLPLIKLCMNMHLPSGLHKLDGKLLVFRIIVSPTVYVHCSFFANGI